MEVSTMFYIVDTAFLLCGAELQGICEANVPWAYVAQKLHKNFEAFQAIPN